MCFFCSFHYSFTPKAVVHISTERSICDVIYMWCFFKFSNTLQFVFISVSCNILLHLCSFLCAACKSLIMSCTTDLVLLNKSNKLNVLVSLHVCVCVCVFCCKCMFWYFLVCSVLFYQYLSWSAICMLIKCLHLIVA